MESCTLRLPSGNVLHAERPLGREDQHYLCHYFIDQAYAESSAYRVDPPHATNTPHIGMIDDYTLRYGQKTISLGHAPESAALIRCVVRHGLRASHRHIADEVYGGAKLTPALRKRINGLTRTANRILERSRGPLLSALPRGHVSLEF